MATKVAWRGRQRLLLLRLTIFAFELLIFLSSVSSQKTLPRKQVERAATTPIPAVRLQTEEDNGQVVIDNGLVRVTLSIPGGFLAGIEYNGIPNVLESDYDHNNRGYWDVVWGNQTFDRMSTTDFKIVTQNEDQVELSFTKTWKSSDRGKTVPLNIDKRFIIRRGCPGIYMYAILERLEGFPAAEMDQIRIVFKLQEKMFEYMAISDDRQRMMPSIRDREPDRSEILAYKEAVLLTNPAEAQFRGEVDDKYQYSMEDKDIKVHGWISNDPNPVGFWMITPSNEFRAAGPVKQDLTSHAGPFTLSMFVSTHYAGKDLVTEYAEGEAWKKVFGPVLVYLNSASKQDEDPKALLWNDAKRQMWSEVENWPYNFVESKDFPPADQRGAISGQLLVRDRYIQKRLMWGQSAFIGLAPPGDIGSWQTEAKGYQFWVQADNKGRFFIGNVRAGNYNLYAWVPGFLGDFKLNRNITITPGTEIKLEFITYDPPRKGPTLWEIGYPDRTAAEFFIPDPYPTLMNPLYTDHPDKYRQYGLWERYADMYPRQDLMYTVGVSDFSRDWFFAHVTRNVGNRTYQATTWQIVFQLRDVQQTGNYTFQLALASATVANVEVRINDPEASMPDFSTGRIGKDNAIARHGIHGLYRLYSIDVASNKLVKGKNTIYLTQSLSLGPFQGVMYDYLRLEGPGT